MRAKSPTTSPTCILCDDHSVVRDGLRARLENDGWVDIVGEADSGERTLELIRKLEPDLAIVDIRMPGGDGFTVASAVREAGLKTRIILYTVFSDPKLVERAFESGALGYVGKEAPPEVVLRAVREVHAGRKFIDPMIAGSDSEHSVRLSQREMEILNLLALGHSNTRIGKELFLTGETVKSHVSSILAKLEADSRTQAVAIAIRHGLID